MPETKPSAMQQIIEALDRAEVGLANAKSYVVLPATEQNTVISALDAVRAAIVAARAMQEQQAGVPAGWKLVPLEPTPAMIEAGRVYAECAIHSNAVFGYRDMLAASPSAPPVAADERTSAAPEGLAAHAIEELCQLGYTVRDGKLIPPDNLHELARVAGWASPSGGRATGDSVQQPVATAEQKLAQAGVFKGADGLRRLAECQEFWDRLPYGTRLCFEDSGDGYLHRDVLRAAVAALDASPSNPEAQQAAKPVAAAGYQLAPIDPTPEMLHIGSGWFRTRGHPKGIASAAGCWAAMLAASPTAPAPATMQPTAAGPMTEGQKDAQRLDWLDATTTRFRMGWKVGMAPAGNVSVQTVIQLGTGPLTTIRQAIDAAMEAAK